MAHSSYSDLTCIRYNHALSSIKNLYETTFRTEYHYPTTLHEHSDQIMEMLSQKYQESTLVNFVSAVLWSVNQLDRSQYPEEFVNDTCDKYRVHGKRLKDSIDQQRAGREFQLTEKEQKSFMIWEDILQLYETISKQIDLTRYSSFLDYVILSLYILQPPVRADYANMNMFIEDSFIPDDFSENYCVLQTNPRFVFHKYKTAKHRGTTVVPMDDRLHDILIQWAHINTSDFLLSSIVQSTQTFKVMTENTLSKRLTSIFLTYSKKPVTINTLRHSFISFMSKYDQEYDKKCNNADKMMHSLSMADRYRRLVYPS